LSPEDQKQFYSPTYEQQASNYPADTRLSEIPREQSGYSSVKMEPVNPMDAYNNARIGGGNGGNGGNQGGLPAQTGYTGNQQSGLRADNTPQVLHWGEQRFTNSGDTEQDAGINYRQGLRNEISQRQNAAWMGGNANAEAAKVNASLQPAESGAARIGLAGRLADTADKRAEAVGLREENRATQDQRRNDLMERRTNALEDKNNLIKPRLDPNDITGAMDPKTPTSEILSAQDVFTNPKGKGYAMAQQMMDDLRNDPQNESKILEAFVKASGISRDNLLSILRYNKI
jgi:hypothetical protein